MNPENVKEKASQCLGCTNPKCQDGCPLKMDIPSIMKFVKEDDYESAYKKIIEKSYLGSVCGRVCPHEQQCEGECVRGISSSPVSIGEIEKTVADWGLNNYKEEMPPITHEKIAVIGSGPAGLSCAIELRKRGYDVTIFERETTLGGILRYGIPEYRLSNKTVDQVIENILQYGINVRTEKNFGVNFTLEDLIEEGFSAAFLGIGNDMPKMLPVPGINLKGVYWANDFLRNIDNLKFENVVVIGGGNVAMDSCRMAKLKGAKNVTVVYRKAKIMMKASNMEIMKAEQEGIQFKFEAVPVEIVGSDSVDGILCNDGDTILADTVVMAIGALPNYDVLSDDIELSEDSLIKVDENGETNINGLFAGGDLIEKRATVCAAIKSAKTAAEGIDRKLRETEE